MAPKLRKVNTKVNKIDREFLPRGYRPDGGVFIFCDGHARWLKVTETEKDNFYL